MLTFSHCNYDGLVQPITATMTAVQPIAVPHSITNSQTNWSQTASCC